MTKRNMWTYDETLEMLNIMLEQESLKAMNGRPFRKDKAFRLICEEMMQRGYNTKDPKQIEYRWKNLKKHYMELQRDPNLNDTNPFQYYDEIDVLIKGKPPSTMSKLYELSISRVELKPNKDAEGVFTDTNSLPTMQEDSEGDSVKSEENNTKPAIVAPSPQVKCSPRRSKRSRKPLTYRPNETQITCLPPYSITTEQEAYRNQKKLIDYQFGLYSKVQEESDQKFLDMSRQMLDECNERFQSFVEKLVSGSSSGS
ncbi:uncharacterized protein LOC128709236 [Anopheles marshallii]|uniref:uncharacterized protein LOC128709236 n=1 Tax=Anopheles marshallii TaxID=1521116 RepID=UPI00237A3235|nr:uncharacterized protein LOC128709236 [Anopheles marshallii]